MRLIIILLLFSISCFMFGQQVEFNLPTVISPVPTNVDPSAIMQMESDYKGLLIPRMDSLLRIQISSPAEGLLVYDLTTRSFWYYQNAAWVDLNKINRAFEKANGVVRNSGNHSSDDFVFGSPELDYYDDPMHASRMFFNKDKAAFRAGTTSTEGGHPASWNDQFTGSESFAFGGANVASGFGSGAWGAVNEALGQRSTSWGILNRAIGFYTTCFGSDNQALSAYETVFGRYNALPASSSRLSWVPTDFLLAIGNGSSNEDRSNALSLLKNGHLGLGLTDPEHELSIFDQEADEDVAIRLYSESGSARDFLLGFNTSSSPFLRTTSNDPIRFQTNGPNTRMSIGTNGNVGIGTVNPDALLVVNGDIVKKVNGGSWTATSDRRLKKDITNYGEGLNEVMSICPVRFHYDKQTGHDTLSEYIGVIAQDLETVAPHMVSSFQMGDEDYLQVDNSAMTYMLINAVKEQQDKIAHLEARIRTLGHVPLDFDMEVPTKLVRKTLDSSTSFLLPRE